MALPITRAPLRASLWRSGYPLLPVLVQSRSFQVSSNLAFRRPTVESVEEKFPGSYQDTVAIPMSNGMRRVEPPDWDGSMYLDKKGWFQEWLFGRSPSSGGAVDGAYMPQSRREYHEWETLLHEARDMYFGSYPPTPIPQDYYERVLDFCIKYDNEKWLHTTFRDYQKTFAAVPEYKATEDKVNEYLSLKRQERWDAW